MPMRRCAQFMRYQFFELNSQDHTVNDCQTLVIRCRSTASCLALWYQVPHMIWSSWHGHWVCRMLTHEKITGRHEQLAHMATLKTNLTHISTPRDIVGSDESLLRSRGRVSVEGTRWTQAFQLEVNSKGDRWVSLSVGCVENWRSRVGVPHIEIVRRPNLNFEVEGQGIRDTREETVDEWFRRWQAAVI